MTVDGTLSLWGANGPVVWHSETSGVNMWYYGGVYSDYKASVVSITDPMMRTFDRGLDSGFDRGMR